MTPEEKFNNEIWWVLQKIHTEELRQRKGEPIEWVMQARPISTLPPIGVREKMLLKIEELGGIKIINKEIVDNTYGKDFIYIFEIIRPKFDEIYSLYENSQSYRGDKKIFEFNNYSLNNLKKFKKTINLLSDAFELQGVTRLLPVIKLRYETISKEGITAAEMKLVFNKFNEVYGKKVLGEIDITIPSISISDTVPPHSSKEEIERITDITTYFLVGYYDNNIVGILKKLGEAIERAFVQKTGVKDNSEFSDLSKADKKKLALLEKLKEEWDLTPKVSYLEPAYGGYSYERKAGEVRISQSRLPELEQSCSIADNHQLQNILEILRQDQLISDFEFPDMLGEYLKIQLPKDFDERFYRYKTGILGITETQKQITSIPEINNKPYAVIENGQGYFKFQKHGGKIKIGAKESRHFRLLMALCEPHFGVHKTIFSIFEAIRLPNDANDTHLNDGSLAKARKLQLIEFAKKELQKIKELQGKIRYKFDGQKNNMWIELEG